MRRAAPARVFRQNAGMAGARIPLLILGGSDRKPAVLPAGGPGKRPLRGYKGADLRIGGRPLIALLIERLKACAEFDPLWIAGPSRIYREAETGVPVIDTDSTFAGNIRLGLETILEAHPPGPVAVITCDVLPDPAELKALLLDYHGQGACDVWFPLIRAPGEPDRPRAFAWKPDYRIVPEAGAAPVRVLPGHLLIADIAALRLDLVYRLLHIAYCTRNRPIAARRRSMAARVIFRLLYQDLLRLLSLRLPALTWTLLASGLRMAHRLKAGTILRSELEEAVGKIVVRSRHRRRFPRRGVRLPILEGPTLAQDIDTEEEAEALEQRWKESGGSGPLRPTGPVPGSITRPAC